MGISSLRFHSWRLGVPMSAPGTRLSDDGRPFFARLAIVLRCTQIDTVSIQGQAPDLVDQFWDYVLIESREGGLFHNRGEGLRIFA